MPVTCFYVNTVKTIFKMDLYSYCIPVVLGTENERRQKSGDYFRK